ncbi:HNH endonuclease [Nostoc sp.]|uniref:HNH endonuclease n=1 Tax=Nostoc sp. TaxID=1180 RepID=UPI002FF5D25F
MGANPEMPSRTAKLLKQQKGKCPHCGLLFRNEDVMEIDYIIPRATGGKDDYKNLQLLHRHCHDVKSKTDLIKIQEYELERLRQGNKPKSSRKKRKSPHDKGTPE